MCEIWLVADSRCIIHRCHAYIDAAYIHLLHTQMYTHIKKNVTKKKYRLRLGM
jgi:hypothetical protein